MALLYCKECELEFEIGSDTGTFSSCPACGSKHLEDRIIKPQNPETPKVSKPKQNPYRSQNLEGQQKQGLISLVDVEGGTFVMGNVNGDYDEKPEHPVTVSSFRIGQTPITQGQWEKVMGTNPRYEKNRIGEEYPVITVSWYDCLVFCNKLSLLEKLEPVYRLFGSPDPNKWGFIPEVEDKTWNSVEVAWNAHGYRLPTEAEWEYAARGGNESKKYLYSGSNDVDEVAWYEDNNDGCKPVALKKPNELGIYDMSGNVWEWVWDWWGEYSKEPMTDPLGPSSGRNRVLRGGSWRSDASITSVSVRIDITPGNRHLDSGLRVIRP